MCVSRWRIGQVDPAAAEQGGSLSGELTAAPRHLLMPWPPVLVQDLALLAARCSTVELTPGDSGHMMVITVSPSPAMFVATSLIKFKINKPVSCRGDEQA